MEVIKMKNRIKYLALFTIMFIFSACSGLFEFKPYFTTFVYDHRIYGIIENGKINRMGISREKVNKMNHIISNKYGIKFFLKYHFILSLIIELLKLKKTALNIV